MTKLHNVFDVPLDGPTREFRVSPLKRYQVTDWTDYRGGAGTRVVAENLTLEQANSIATELGRAQPGSLVNLMEAPYEGGYVMVTSRHGMSVAMALSDDGALPLDVALTTLPYEFAAKIRRWARGAADFETLAALDAAKVAVDA